jgi:hypothetical protein
MTKNLQRVAPEENQPTSFHVVMHQSWRRAKQQQQSQQAARENSMMLYGITMLGGPMPLFSQVSVSCNQHFSSVQPVPSTRSPHSSLLRKTYRKSGNSLESSQELIHCWNRD